MREEILMEISKSEAVDNILLFANEGRLVQGIWHRKDADGRHLACLLAAIHPDIDGPEKCPALIMPQWMASVLPMLFDSVAKDRAIPLGIQFAESLKVGNTDDGVMRRWLIRVVQDAVSRAALHSKLAPAIWPQAKMACYQVIDALKTGDKTAADKAAARVGMVKKAAARAGEATTEQDAYAAEVVAETAAAAEAAAEAMVWAGKVTKAAEAAAWATGRAVADVAVTWAWAAGKVETAQTAAAAEPWMTEATTACDRMFVALIEEMLRGVEVSA
jgi:hypothetical protein